MLKAHLASENVAFTFHKILKILVTISSNILFVPPPFITSGIKFTYIKGCLKLFHANYSETTSLVTSNSALTPSINDTEQDQYTRQLTKSRRKPPKLMCLVCFQLTIVVPCVHNSSSNYPCRLTVLKIIYIPWTLFLSCCNQT